MKINILKPLLTIACLLCSIGVYAHDFEVDGIYYKKYSKTVEVTFRGSYYDSYNNEYTGSIVIPEKVTYNNVTYSVTSIGDDAFCKCTGLTSITIPNSVSSIGKDAFRGCTGLTEVTIPNSVTAISSYAFAYCSGLTSITIPNSVTSIDSRAFYNCTGLTEITIGNSVTSIGYAAFSGCTGLTEVTIGNSVTSIGEWAFAECTGLTEVTIPNSVTSIGAYAFYDCTGLTSVTIPNSVTSIGDDAFYKCTGLTEITIPNSVTSIGDDVFQYCTGLTSVTIPNSVTAIGYYAFYGCTGLTTVTFNAENCITMGSSSCPVFTGCNNLKTLNIGESVKAIPNYAFYGCTGLTSIVVDKDNPTYDSRDNCNAIIKTATNTLIVGCKNSFIPNSVTSIGEAAFYNCTGLKEITIPNSVTSIGEDAFSGCSYLKIVINLSGLPITRGSSGYGYVAYYANKVINAPNGTIEGDYIGAKKDGVNTLCGYLGNASEITLPGDYNGENYVIGDYVFQYCTGLTSVTIPNSVTAIGYYAFNGCSSLKSLTIEDGDSELKLGYNGSNEGLFYDCPIEILYIGRNLSYNTSYSYGYSPFYNKKELKTVTIGNSVTSIGSYAFYNCTGLVEVTIPNSVTSIGDGAFEECTGLTSVTIGNSVTSIGEYAFEDCSGLTTINFNAENCTTMGSFSYPVFEGCNNLKTLNIGESVKTIPDYAFEDCSGLTSVTIGNSVTSIGSYAFYGCNIAKTIWLTNTPPNGYKNVSSKVHYVANEQYTGLSNVKIYPYISSLFETGGVKYVPVSPSERTCDAIDCLYNKNVTDVKIDSTVSYRGVAMTVKEVMPYTLYNQDYIKILSINNSGNIGNYACYDCDSISSAILTNNGNVGEEAFYSCKNLTTATLGDSIKSIGSNAFENCTRLSEIVIPNGVISIGESAFYGCTGLTKAIIGNSVTSISSSAFGGCASLDSIYIGRKVATVGENAFSDCKKLADITIPASVTTIGDYVFSGCTSLSDVVIEDRTTALSLGSNGSSGLFADCPLDSVYIGGKITYKTSSSYGYSPFYRNTSLRTVVITDTETEIYDNEFYGCSNLTKVTIGDGVKKIGNWAFSGCSSLDHFAFGTNVESIGQEAFSDCTNVTNIRSYSAVPPMCGTQALDDINKWNCTLSVLENCQSAYQTAEQWKDFFFVNAMDKDGKVATPVITVDSVVVTISCKTAKTTIYYTTDGSEPTVESAQYTGPFEVDKNCTIKAIAVRTNYYNSDVSTAQVDYFVYAESIAIDYETVSIRLNESVTLTATVLPETTANRVVVWSSSDENIATVENGIVTAHTIGEATITATTTDGSNLSATCEVTVEPTLATSITLDQTNITAIEGETVVLTATIYPDDVTEKAVVWSVSDVTIATIEPIDNVSAKITVLREGVATITATTIDGSNLSATCTIDVYSGIKNVQLDDTPTEYYDLSGRRVEHPTQGVYITKQGSTVRKVVVNER